MEIIVIAALVFSIIFFLSIGFKYGKKNKTLSDIFPIFFGKNASIDSANELSSSSIASTVSLATILMAYFQLAGYFGLFLLWTAITTALGMYLLSRLSKIIWKRIAVYNHRPTLHYWLGTEYNNKNIAIISSLCSVIGTLLLAALELIVGSQFLAQLVPSIPPTLTAIVLSATGIIYLSMGGFKVVIRSDVWQLRFIKLLIVAFFIYFVYDLILHNSLSTSFANIPENIYDFSYRDGLWMFLIGIAVMNIPTHLSSQGMFQRLNASQTEKTVIDGLKNSTKGIFSAWTLIVIIACLAYMFVPHSDPQNLLPNLLKYISITTFGKFILFIITIGMYSALLSTASTNLVVVGHIISEDIMAKYKEEKNLVIRDASKREFNQARLILLAAGLFSVLIVQGLKFIGFDIADLVFSIYGGSLALFPAILISLLNKRDKLKELSTFAIIGIILGFFIGWGVAFYGKFTNHPNLVFLSPVFSIGISSLCLITGLILQKSKAKSS